MIRATLSSSGVIFQSFRTFMRNVAQGTSLAASQKKERSVANPLKHDDYFGVRDLITMEDLFHSRVHYGHQKGCRHHTVQPYIFGCRNGVDIINLDETHDHLIRALNFLSHVVYAGGLVLFVMRSHIHGHMVETMANECGEFALTRRYHRDLLLQRNPKDSAKLPDVCVFLSLLDNVNSQHLLITDCAKVNIATIGIADTNSDMSMVTYPIPGNDDSHPCVELYCKLFKTCVLNAKKRKEIDLQSADNL